MFISQCRRKTLYQQLRQDRGQVFRQLAQQRESKILEGHLVVDHVDMLIPIPLQYPVAGVIGFIRGMSTIHITRTVGDRQTNFTGQQFWARGYFASTVGRGEKPMRGYTARQQDEDRRLEQMQMFD